MRGSVIMARASATRWRWPPDRLPGLRSARAAISKAFSTSCTRLAISALGFFSISRPKPTCLATVMCGKSAKSWNIMAMSRCHGGSLVTSLPPIRMPPSSGSSRPATQRKVVVLPQPEGPSRQTNWPFSTLSETPSTAVKSP